MTAAPLASKIDALLAARVVPVLRYQDAATAAYAAEVAVAAGCTTLELTWTIPGVTDLVRAPVSYTHLDSGFAQGDGEPAAQGVGQADFVGGVQVGQGQHAFRDVAGVEQFGALHAGQTAAVDRRGVPVAVQAQVDLSLIHI